MKNNEIRRGFLEYFIKHGHLELPSASVVPDNDPTLMFTSAGMVQFKDIFTGNAKKPEPPRVVTSQKCLRAGGKHNDLENVGYTTRHHTFFEMLGNFSFGDYFKERAIELAWNLITQEFGLPKDKLLVTVYHDDDKAAGYWRKIAGLRDDRILRIATSDNFWQMGDTGPCGPCSEIFFDHGEGLPGGPPGTPEEDGPRFIEIWNLVFMQFEQQEGGGRHDLPKPSIDTGMGLERIGAVLQGKHDNYDTDSLRILAEAVGHELGTDPFGAQSASHKVIVDHLRACSFMIADGVMPSNEGRGYVLRRILRRALRHAHLLGAREPMIHKLLPSLTREMGDHFTELVRAETLIAETLRLESERFLDMLDRGLKLLDTEAGEMGKGDTLNGAVAFKLYDTFGFPVDLTADILRSRGAAVDMLGFDAAMNAQKARARAAWTGMGDAGQDQTWQAIPDHIAETDFLGYTLNECSAEIQAIIVDGVSVESIHAPATAMVITNQTPFYAEAGGQVGDQGTLETSDEVHKIVDTQKQRGIYAHRVEINNGSLQVKDAVKLSIDSERRGQLRTHHSATHLLHSALRSVLGDHVAQKGSMVSPEALRFDFSHAAPLTEAEKERIEILINEEIRANTEITTRVMTPEVAIETGATALFGEKYGDEVRVVSMGRDDEGTPFSLELCGGTHVERTGDIGLLMLRSERGTAAGIRRIEAVCGASALQTARTLQQRLQSIAENLKVAPAKIENRLESLIAERAALNKQLTKAQQQTGTVESEQVGKTTLYFEHRPDASAKNLKPLTDQWRQKHAEGVYLVIATEGKKASIVVASQDQDIDAVTLVRLVSAALGGNGGGGRADLAQAGGSDTSDTAIQNALAVVRQHLST